jgi:hypothetical protein
MLVTKAQHDRQIELEPRKVQSPFNKGDDFGFVPPAQTPSKNCQSEIRELADRAVDEW